MEPIYTADSLRNKKENTYFDRKTARIAPKDLVRHVAAFANANGGVLAVGIEDDGTPTGFTSELAHTEEEYRKAILTLLRPVPSFETGKMKYGEGENEYILLIKVSLSSNQIVRKVPENDVYFRIADSSIKLDHEQILKLEYDKGQRFFEETEIDDASIEEDIDSNLIRQYCIRMQADPETPAENVLKARGLIRNGRLTKAAILLFGNNPTKFLPQARVRFIRYDGIKRLTGERINIVKEKTFDAAIPKILQEIMDFIRPQMREFQTLGRDGRFRIVPEYPEFAWMEGIVNAVTHRDYSVSGDHIRISMYDDRLEIFSPGKLPNIVTLENMKYTRFSRNPQIARILTEFGWVKELNEGVNRIYSEMHSFYLREPQYTEPNAGAVSLVLENSIASRAIRVAEQLSHLLSEEWENLTKDEQRILQYLYAKRRARVKNLCEETGKSPVFVRARLKKLIEKGIIERVGNSLTDPHQYYVIKNMEKSDPVSSNVE